jgi:transaldolase
MSLLEKLVAHSVVVPETAELSVVKHFGATHVNLSASRITAAAQQPEQSKMVMDAIDWAQKKVGKGGNRKLVSMHAVDRLAIEFAREILTMISGNVSIEVDGRLAFKRRQLIDRGRALIDHLEELEVDTKRVRLKMPATWEGIEAARKLREKNDILCHMTLVFGLHQLAACADAGVALVSPAVGRISDWHKKKMNVDGFEAEADPGVQAAIEMHDYLARHGYETQLMPGTFRSIEQALALSGCELLTLPPKLLNLLEEMDHNPERRVDKSGAAERGKEKIEVDASMYQTMHAADPCANDKLSGAIRNLSFAVVSQEKQLADFITKHQDAAAETPTLALFRIWDYDGDGFIDREEWNGTPEVFNALDRDNNGRISLEEMAIGLGAPYKPSDD